MATDSPLAAYWKADIHREQHSGVFMYFIQTDRIGLRKFNNDDLPGFAALNSDPTVMEYFPELLSAEKCAELMERINSKIDQCGYGFWAAEHLDSGQLMGFVGLNQIDYETNFTPATEIGWRLAHKFWGKGLATEAACACLAFAFNQTDLNEVVSFTSCLNEKSYRVMQRLGMTKIGEFNHPKVPSGHRLEKHALYSISRSQFEQLSVD